MKKQWFLVAALIIILGLLVGCSDSGATTGVINGYVRYSTGGSEIAVNAVVVNVLATSFTNTSSGAGVYSITGVTPGTYSVTADFTGKIPVAFTANGGEVKINYQPQYTAPVGLTLTANNVNVTAGNTTSVDFTIFGTSP